MRQNKSPKNSKDQILIAASNLFAKGGSQALSVRAIAEAAGMSTIGIYSHFKGKQGILDALFIDGFNMVYHAMLSKDDNATPKEALLEAIKGYLHVALNYEGHYRLIFGERDAGYEPSEDAQLAAERAFGQLVKRVSFFFSNCGDDVELPIKQGAAMELWALLHGYVSLKHHVTANFMSESNWYNMVIDSVSSHIDALTAKYSTLK